MTINTQTIPSEKSAARNWGIGWMLALFGFPLGGLLVTLLIGPLATPLQGVVGGLVAGVAVGAAQWLALRRFLPIAPLWIAVTAIGLALGVGLGMALVGADTSVAAILTRAPLAGLPLALGQWFVLRRYVRLAVVWPVAGTLVYVLAWFITAQVIGDNRSEGFVVFGSSGALVYQALMGLTLRALLRSTP